MTAITPICVDRNEAAEICRVSPATFDAHVRPNLTAIRVGRCVRYHVDQLRAWVDEQAGFERQSAPDDEKGDFETWAEGFDGGA